MSDLEKKLEEKLTNTTTTIASTPATDTNERKKQPLTFVSEGVSDVATQKKKEEEQQARYENERQRRNRKTLQDQLRANAIKKQRQFKQQVKKKESFNRLNKNELDYFQKIRKDEDKKENELNEYLSSKIDDFEIKKKLLGNKGETTISESVKKPSTVSVGIVKKKKHKKIGISLQKLDSK
ncbi:protein Fyv6p [Monosporozyma servazzii]